VTGKFFWEHGVKNNVLQKRFEGGEGYEKRLLRVFLYGTDMQMVKNEE
jgi:hypothetical protein